MSKPIVIDNDYLAHQKKGYALNIDLSTAPPSLPEAGYISAHDWRLRPAFSDSANADTNARKKRAAPAVMGYLDDCDDGPDIISEGIRIKRPNSAVISLPACFGFATGMGEFVARDALSLLGAKRFSESDIVFVAQRNTIPANQAHRPDFAGWHNHLKEGGEIDYVWSFADKLATEFREKGHKFLSHENSIVRFGAEIEHRSRRNDAGENLRRLWGAFIVRLRPGGGRRNEANNDVFSLDCEPFPAQGHFKKVEPIILANE